MATYSFERETRTPSSESYTVHDGAAEIGRVDIHFTTARVVYATLCSPIAFTEHDVEELIAQIDERLVLPADPEREDFVVTVWRGTRMGIFSEDDEDGDVNGASPH
jgi:hypothetical protein